MIGITHWIERRADLHPTRVAVITEEKKVSYKELQHQIEKVSSYLMYEMNVQKGDRIAVLSQNRLEYIVLLFAIAKIQCIAVPLNTRLTIHELVYQLNDSGTTILFAEEKFNKTTQEITKQTNLQLIKIEKLSQLPESNQSVKMKSINADDPYIICYTSGTTGSPKGAVLTQNNMYWNAINNVLAIDITAKDRSVVLLPLFHIGGIGLFAFPTLFTGGSIIIPGKFEPKKVISMIEKYRATIVMGVPSIHKALLECPTFHSANLQSVRWFYSGGAPCPIELMEAFTRKGFLFGQGFGLTETSPTVFMLSEEDAERKRGSVGKPALFCDYKIVDKQDNEVNVNEVGNLIVRGPNVFKKYWNNSKATAESIKNGWFYTGDLAQVDEEGFVYIIGRQKEMIISGGENIYPLEVEQVISKLPEINEVAVVGMMDSKWGEVPVAFIVKNDSASLTKEKILNHCEIYLAKYKIPKKIYFLEDLPKNSTGKVQKNILIKMNGQVKEYDEV